MLDPDATAGLAEVSHLEVVFLFRLGHRVRPGATHPRGNPAWPRVGVLAGHSPVRPNHLGVSRCRLLAVAGLELTVQGFDAVDGTPIIDIKPCASGFQTRGHVRAPAWIRDPMADSY